MQSCAADRQRHKAYGLTKAGIQLLQLEFGGSAPVLVKIAQDLAFSFSPSPLTLHNMLLLQALYSVQISGKADEQGFEYLRLIRSTSFLIALVYPPEV